MQDQVENKIEEEKRNNKFGSETPRNSNKKKKGKEK